MLGECAIDTRRIVVTGASSPGCGEAITRRLLQGGFSIIGTYEEDDADNAKSLSREFISTSRLQLAAVDHASRESLTSFVHSVKGPINGLVNAQSFFNMEDSENFDYELWDRSIAINLSAPNFLIHELVKKMDDNSAIAVISSIEGFIGSFRASARAATNAAIHNLIKSCANNLGHRNIRVNAVAVGWVGGVMDTDEIFNRARYISPGGRLGSAEEIAAVTYFLMSNESSFVNGAVITADGGYTGVDTIAKFEFEQIRKQE